MDERPRRRVRRAVAPALAMALVFAAACSGTESESGGSSEAEPSATTAAADEWAGELSALAYNVAGLPDILSGSNPEQNTALIGPKLNDYDLVLLQESWKTPEPNPVAPTRVYHEILEEASDHEHQSEMADQPLGELPERTTALLADGLGFFSRYPMSEVTREMWEGCFGGADTDDGGAGDCLATKGYAVTTVTLPDGSEVDVYTLHAEAGSTAEDQSLQRADFEQLAAFIQEHSAGRAIILGGDTNLHTDEVPEDPQDVEDTEIWNEFLEATGLVDVCAEQDCPEPGRIDKFAYRSGDDVELESRSWSFETDVFVDDAGEALSDHDALAVGFAWRPVD